MLHVNPKNGLKWRISKRGRGKKHSWNESQGRKHISQMKVPNLDQGMEGDGSGGVAPRTVVERTRETQTDR